MGDLGDGLHTSCTFSFLVYCSFLHSPQTSTALGIATVWNCKTINQRKTTYLPCLHGAAHNWVISFQHLFSNQTSPFDSEWGSHLKNHKMHKIVAWCLQVKQTFPCCCKWMSDICGNKKGSTFVTVGYFHWLSQLWWHPANRLQTAFCSWQTIPLQTFSPQRKRNDVTEQMASRPFLDALLLYALFATRYTAISLLIKENAEVVVVSVIGGLHETI